MFDSFSTAFPKRLNCKLTGNKGRHRSRTSYSEKSVGPNKREHSALQHPGRAKGYSVRLVVSHDHPASH